MRTSCASSCSGLSTGIAAIVVQFGLAMMPLRTSARACGLTSATTRGTSGSRRQAELLSTTVTPASANRGACTREVEAPAEKIAMSSPVGSAVAASSTVISPSPHGSELPAERAEAKKRSSLTGNPRSARICRTTLPTWPVAPTMPTRSPSLEPDRKSTRLNSSHANISYAVFCLKKKKHIQLTEVWQQRQQRLREYVVVVEES